jgi:hypothetical protein
MQAAHQPVTLASTAPNCSRHLLHRLLPPALRLPALLPQTLALLLLALLLLLLLPRLVQMLAVLLIAAAVAACCASSAACELQSGMGAACGRELQ